MSTFIKKAIDGSFPFPSLNPAIAFFMKVDTRLIRTIDGKEIYSREFEYKSSNHSSADWFDTEARLLRDEIDNCFRELPKQIVEELFGEKPC